MHDGVVGDWTVGQLEHADRIVKWMQADEPIAVIAPTKCEGELASITPLLLAWNDFGKLDCAFADARQRIANDAALRFELRIIANVL
jgi:hypothetical protein